MKHRYVIASDHAGFKLKESLKRRFNAIDWLDVGTDAEDSVDYPDFGKAAADAVAGGQADRGVVICGSGIGISIAANRNPKIRAALCWKPEVAVATRQHNDANVLALAARFITEEEAFAIFEAFANTEFEGGRHERRVEKLGLC